MAKFNWILLVSFLGFCMNEHADCLQLRRLGKAFRRAREICKALPGPWILRTWHNLQQISHDCPFPWNHELEVIFQGAPSVANAEAVATILQKVIDYVQAQQSKHRLKLWKQTMRCSAGKAAAWRKARQATQESPILQHQKHYSYSVMKIAGHLTMDPSRQLDALIKAWDKIFGRYRSQAPSTWKFIQEFGSTMKREQCDLDPLTPNDLLLTMQSLRPSAAGLDGWRPQDLKLLGQTCPVLFQHLASLMNVCETSSKWPTSWTTGYVAMLPKKVNSEGHIEDSMDMRPITVLSALYRSWGRTRCRQLKPWILRVLPEEVFELRSGQGADDMAMDVSFLLENAEVNDEWCAGLSYDFAKCYDHVITSMAIDTLLYRGAPLSVLQGLRGFYKKHCKHFKLGCAFSEAYKPSNGIIQGDPLSNFTLASLVACWLEKLSHGNFGMAQVSIKPRLYVDDISATVVAADLNSLRDHLRLTHASVQRFADLSGGRLNPERNVLHMALRKFNIWSLQ